ncbi:glycosyltransferase family 2 protein [Devosia rhodophyticola]|uniref:Glycosyltransferase family 2 protein n=1 Tax=Devosia rhodophyticola TaxID=3026423 RepID=A0ABY7YYC0_9HYPH|nr:glycosyltransferase family 2 protein [Devosia rhodophyticola]WDR06227.1 glycosyltransferase family 2 protein [Devosia rhodophyticola]
MTVQTASVAVGFSASDNRPLALVIVTYNSADTLGGLLDTLADGLEGLSNTEVVIADNASSDNSIALASAHPICPRIIPTGRNGGYAAGINAALATIEAGADVLILNPDIRLSRGAAARLVAALRLPGVGVAAPRVVHEDGTPSFSLRREPTVLTAWADALLGDKLGSSFDQGECIVDDTHYRIARDVDWASGAALAISAEARERVGPWDETFFLYSEEVDFQRRVRAAGFRIVYEPEAELIHIGGEYGQNSRLYSILTINRIRDYARHHGMISTALFRLAVWTGEALRSAGGSPVHRAGMAAAIRRQPSGANWPKIFQQQ